MSKRLHISVRRKAFRGRNGPIAVLQAFDLFIEAGEVFVLLGPSGCGKTTLLRMIVGLDTDYEGEIEVGERLVQAPGPDRSMVFQEPRLLPWMSVHQNVKFAFNRRERKDQMDRAVSEILSMVDLDGVGKLWPRQLSGGMAQRVSVARALINRPEIVLLDEPFGSLDIRTRARLQDMLLTVLGELGTTALLVTHDVDEALYLADRIGVMSPGPGRLLNTYEITSPRPRRRVDAAQHQLRQDILDNLYNGIK